MEIIKKLKENVEIILPADGLEEKIKEAAKENRKLVIKLGFDPTAPDLHLGHAVVLKKLKLFQDMGHEVIILVGSFTARIGDPTGKNKSRKPLSIEEVKQNAETYIKQLSKIIDVEKAKIVYNSEWLDALSFPEILQILAKVTVAQLMHRKDFNKRFTENSPIAMHELMYPILQGFDSVKIKCDIEMGGTDQLFNCTMGRQLQETFSMSPQIVMCMPLLKGIDGKEKMSKSLNNTIGLTDSPNEMFGKTMSVPDALIPDFIDLAAEFSLQEKMNLFKLLENGENPMKIKKIIAKNIIEQYHNIEESQKAEQFFSNQFQNKDFDSKSFVSVQMSDFSADESTLALVELCHKLKSDLTRSAIKRLIESGAVQIDNIKSTLPYSRVALARGIKIKIGKRNFYELK